MKKIYFNLKIQIWITNPRKKLFSYFELPGPMDITTWHESGLNWDCGNVKRCWWWSTLHFEPVRKLCHESLFGKIWRVMTGVRVWYEKNGISRLKEVWQKFTLFVDSLISKRKEYTIQSIFKYLYFQILFVKFILPYLTLIVKNTERNTMV